MRMLIVLRGCLIFAAAVQRLTVAIAGNVMIPSDSFDDERDGEFRSFFDEVAFSQAQAFTALARLSATTCEKR